MYTDQCLILAGGFGSRLGNITKKTPKPLLTVNKRPFIFFLIKNLYRQGIRDFIILSYYKNHLFNSTSFNNFRDATSKLLKDKKK